MLSFPAKFAALTKQANSHADWLLDLSYDSGTFYFSGAGRQLDNYYHGTVLDWDRINERINLRESKASTADIRIVLANKYPNSTGLLSDELFGSSQYFINQNATIREWRPGCTATSDCPILMLGRVKDIEHDGAQVVLTIEKRQPWDHLVVPQGKSNRGTVGTIAYGDYTPNTTDAVASSMAFYPVPYDRISQNRQYFIGDVDTASEGDPHLYDRSLDIFAPIDSAPTASVTSGDVELFYWPIDGGLERGLVYRPDGEGSGNEFDDIENSYDSDADTRAKKTEITQSGSGVTDYDFRVEVPTPEKGLFEDVAGTPTLLVKALIAMTSVTYGGSGTYPKIRLLNQTYGRSDTVVEWDTDPVADGTTPGSKYTDAGGDQYWEVDLRANYSGNMPDYIRLTAQWVCNNAGDSITGDVYVYDVQWQGDFKLTPNTEEFYEAINNIPYGYIGADGYTMGYTGGSGVAKYPQDIFRDMLDRFADWDATGIDYVEVNGADWSASDIDSDKNWDCRYWLLEQKPLVQVLEQLQFEGGFIWLFDNTSSGVEARVVYVKDGTNQTYSAGDVKLTFDGRQLENIRVGHTPFSEIVTKRIYNYQRHPATDDYLESETKTNSGRSNWNLTTNENVQTVNLDFLATQAGVQDLQTYYDNIDGEPKLVVSFSSAYAYYKKVQVGDVVQFSNMPYDPFSASWSGKYFMVTDLTLTPAGISAAAREVG